MQTETAATTKPLQVLFSYSHMDESLLNELKKHLAALRRQGIISTWHDRDIPAGSEWEGKISQQLEGADLILLLISPDFIASDYCWGVEMQRAMERHDAGEALIIPVFLRPCDWKGEIFGKLQGLPTDARPVTGPTWNSRDDAFLVVATGIRNAIAGRKGLAGAPAAPSAPQPSVPAGPAPAYRTPKPRSSGFNRYQAARELFASIDKELAARMASLEAAGYVVDHDQSGEKSSFRVLSDDRTVYFLDMRKEGLGGSDDGLSFLHGSGNSSHAGNSTTASATPVPDENTGEASLDVLNMSLLGYASGKKVYTREEFVDTLWDQIVKTVDQLGRQ